MLAVNDTVHYGMDGVCRVTDIVSRKVDGRVRRFYELHPYFRKNIVVFLPVDNDQLLSRVRPVLDKKEILSAIHGINEAECIWIDQENARRETYQLILRSGDHKQLVRLIKTLTERRSSLNEDGKKMRSADSACLKEAERLLHEEFAFVLGIEPDAVPAFIRKNLSEE
ncbi:MAG: CarD family transcriptional regulator [Lachnospiraceae bacterium]|nr:CarD family transcriptional regulator [Lachnospiraceae bacterium]